MNIVDNVLTQLGLNDKEKKVYTTCLKYSNINASSLARLINQPRTTVYGIIERLLKKSLIKSQQTAKGTIFSAVSADEILILLHKQREQLDEQMELLTQHKNEFELMGITQFKNLPSVNYYEGLDAVHMFYRKYTQAKETMALFDIDSALQYSEYTIEKLASIPSEGGGMSKEILLESPSAQQYKKLLESEQNQIKLLTPDSSLRISSDTVITEKAYYHIAYSESPIIIEIKNDIFLQTQKLFFMELWNRL